MKELKISILSDLHCHHSKDKTESFLLSDSLRIPPNEHPVESLSEIIKDESLQSDLTLCPGDFTNKNCLQGLISGWNYSLEIHEKLKSKDIIATIGNHDIDSRLDNASYSFNNVRGIGRDFPIEDLSNRSQFFEIGYTIVERNDFRVLVINSSHFHHNTDEAAKGKISDEAIEKIKKELNELSDDKIQIAMSHHPPIEHSRNKLGDSDHMEEGARLLDLLIENCFDLYIYGHKHDPLYSEYVSPVNSKKISIFSSGSFSAKETVMFTGERNCFHILTIIKDSFQTKGTIDTWRYTKPKGWGKIVDEGSTMPSVLGFGFSGDVKNISCQVLELFKDIEKISWTDIIDKVTDVRYLNATQLKELGVLLEQEECIISGEICRNPKLIYKSK